MVENIQELRLEREPNLLRDREDLGNRRIVEGLMWSVEVEDLPERARRCVHREVLRIAGAAGRIGLVFGIDEVDISTAGRADMVNADRALQISSGDSVEDHAA